MPTSASIDVSSGSLTFCCARDGLQRAEEAGRVAGGEELLGVGAAAPSPPRPFGVVSLTSSAPSSDFDVPFAAAGRGGVGGVEDLVGLDGHGVSLAAARASADRFCERVDLRAELEPALLQPLDLLDDRLEALAVLGQPARRRRRAPRARPRGRRARRRGRRAGCRSGSAPGAAASRRRCAAGAPGRRPCAPRGVAGGRRCGRARHRAGPRCLGGRLGRHGPQSRRVLARRLGRGLRLLEQPALVVVEVAVERLDSPSATTSQNSSHIARSRCAVVARPA